MTTNNNNASQSTSVFEQIFAAPTPASLATSNQQEKAKSMLWLNVGIRMPNILDEHGNPVLCNLPMGIALDNLKERQVSAKSETVGAQAMRAGNELLKVLKQTAEKLQPGQTLTLPNIEVTLYKVDTSASQSADAADNAAVISSLLGIKS